jgi:hypothetical protein
MHERLVELLDEVDTARGDLAETLERVRESLEVRSIVARPGFRLSEQDALPGVELHEQLIARLERMHHAVAAARAESIRIMVDEEGLTVSDVGKLLRRPRQLVSRLYRAAAAVGARR